MIYAALLRGINVGGNSKVDMKQLKAAFEKAGIESVKTYINSGNIIFSDEKHGHAALAPLLEKVIKKEFGFEVRVVVRSFPEMKKIASKIPESWKNDTEQKCDVMYLWKEADSKSVLNQLVLKHGIDDDVVYVKGAIIWRVDRGKVTRSGLLKLVGTPLYKNMTIRNCNTARKLVELMKTAK
ncbi:MAG TPA: DUF1697 domain-containing protein [Candidatus Paceibacterota bacterium]